MKKNLLATSIAFVTAVCITATAQTNYNFVYNGLFYKIVNASLKQVSVVHELDDINDDTNSFYAIPPTGDIVIPGSFNHAGENYQVVSIENEAFFNCSITSVVVESGVTRIGLAAFSSCKQLRTIQLPEGLKTIEANAFMQSGLTSIRIPASLSNIGNRAFYHCGNLQSIEVAAGNAQYASEAGILYNNNKETLICYPCGRASTSFTIPDNVKKIENHAFAYSRLIETLHIGKVESIGGSVFENSEKLKNIHIGESLSSIHSNSFSNCPTLETFEVSNNNINYASFEGVLFNKTKSDLLQYPSGKRDEGYKLPEGVTRIDKSAFSRSRFLKKIELSYGLKTIGAGAFSYCNELETIIFSKSINEIQSNAFQGCLKLRSVLVNWEQPLPIDPSVFSRIALNTVTLTLPSGTSDAYKRAPVWKDFKKPFLESLYYSFKSGKLYYRITNISKREVEVSRELRDFNLSTYSYYSSMSTQPSGGVDIPAEVEHAGQKYSVRSIGEHALNACTMLSSLKIPGSIKTIGNYALYRCSKLERIEVANGNEDFKSVEDVLYNKSGSMLLCYPANKAGGLFSLPAGVEKIAKGAFSESKHLNSLLLPEGVKSIDEHAFFSCNSLESVNLPSSIIQIFPYAFQETTALKELSVGMNPPLSVSGNVFSGLKLNSIQLSVPRGTKNLYESDKVWKDFAPIVEQYYDFKFGDLYYRITDAGAGNVEVSREIREALPATGFYSRAANQPAGDVVIPDQLPYKGKSYRVTSIENGALGLSCLKLRSVKLPATLSQINDDAFTGAHELSQIEVVAGNQHYSSKEGVLYNKAKTRLIHYPAAKAEPAFSIEQGVAELAKNAFTACRNLESLSIPATVSSLGEAITVFNDCSKLKSIQVAWSTAPLLKAAQFGNLDLSTIRLKVPSGTKGEYQTAEVWKNFNPIEEVTGLGSHSPSKPCVWTSPGKLHLIADQDEMLSIYNTKGIELYRLQLQAGVNYTRSLPAGIYLLRTETTIKKISIQ